MTGRQWTAVLGVALALAASAGRALAAETAGEALLQRWIAAANAAGGTVTVGSRSVDAAGGVEWRDVVIAMQPSAGGDTRLRAARFHGLAERDGAYAAARIELDGLSVTDKDGRVTIGAVEIADAFLPDFTAVTLPATPSLAGFLQAFEALKPVKLGRGEIRDIAVDVPNTGSGAKPGERLSFGLRRVGLDELGGGRLGRLAVAGFAMAGSDHGKPLGVGVDMARLERLDLAAIGDFLTRGNYPGGDGDGVWRDIVGSFAIEGARIDAADGRMTLGRYGFDNLALRRVDTGFIDLVEAGAAAAADRSAAARGVLGLLDSLRLGRAGIDRLAFAVAAPAGDGGAAKEARFGLETAELRDLSLAGLGAYRLEGITVAADGVGLALRDFVIADTALPPRAVLAAAVAAVAAGEEPRPATLLPRIGRIGLAGLAVEQPKAGRVALERAELRQSGSAGALPTAAALEIAGLVLPADLPDPAWRDFMARFGRDALRLGARLALRYDAAAATLAMDDLTLTVDDDGKLAAALTLTGVSPELYAAPEKIEDYLGEIGVGGGRIVVGDGGLSERLLAVAAARSGVPAAEMRRVAVERLPQLLAPIQEAARRAAFRAALERFLSPPATLALTARPADPVPVLQVAATIADNPWRLLDILAIEAVAGP
jgi:hypothetical protein